MRQENIRWKYGTGIQTRSDPERARTAVPTADVAGVHPDGGGPCRRKRSNLTQTRPQTGTQTGMEFHQQFGLTLSHNCSTVEICG